MTPKKEVSEDISVTLSITLPTRYTCNYALRTYRQLAVDNFYKQCKITA